MPSLQSIVGAGPANFNMLSSTAFATSTNFTSGFTLDGASITTGVISPNSQPDAQKLVESATGGAHRVYSFNYPSVAALVPDISWRVAVIAKAAERTRIVVFWEVYTHEATITASVGFDLAGGNVGYDNSAGSAASISAYAMTAIGGGWYLCTFDVAYTGTPLGSSNQQPKIYIDNGSGTAARSINYSGNGSSGVDLWWFNLLPTAAWIINGVELYDNFTSLSSSVDLNNTLNPGYKWYVNNKAPNSWNTPWWGSLSPSPASNFSQPSPSIMQIYDPTMGNAVPFTSLIYSVGFLQSGGYVGTAWGAPVIFDGYFSWNWQNNDPDWFAHYGEGPAFWAHMLEAMDLPGVTQWIEWDWVSFGGGGSAVHPSLLSGQGGTTTSYNISDSWVNTASGMVLGEFHRISGMWLDMATTGGKGFYASFFDGQFVQVSDVYYDDTDSWPADPTQPSGAGAWAEGQHFPMMIGTVANTTDTTTFAGWPIQVDWVKVYSPAGPAAPKSSSRMSLGIGIGLTN
jgi:hypothetical protein